MASKLEVYNDALGHLGERKLASLAEAREPRRALDDQWDRGLRYCLEQGLWNFAMRTVSIEPEESVDPAFGLANAFTKPTDWIRTALVSDNERMIPPLNDYVDERGYWYADCDPLYVQFVSDDTNYGLDLSLWPETFAEYVGVYLARKTCKRITGSTEGVKDLRVEERRTRTDARSKDAMNQPVGQFPVGTWAGSRSSGQTRKSRWDGTFL
jgi:hypothetical protein